MKSEEIYINTLSGLTLHARVWEPDDKPKAVIAVLHGLSDHINRYRDFASYMTSHHIIVFGLDQPGHGNSPGKRGHIKSYDIMLLHVQSLLIEIRLRWSELPVFILGQSMGGNLALNFGIKIKSKEVMGLIVCSPWLKLAFDPPKWKTIAASFLVKIAPRVTMSNEIDPMDLSHDPEIGRAYMDDPLNHGKISSKLYYLMMTGGEKAIRQGNNIQIPVLLMHGDADKLTSYKASESLARNSPRFDLKIWPGMRHELFNEKEKQEVLEYILNWVNQIIDRHAKS